jgi:threonine/homoserine/homoserine lactone efflux protein
MLPINDLLLFALAALVLVLSPGPNMIYIVSRSITQGRRAGLLSLAGVLTGFLVPIFLVSFGLTAVVFSPFLPCAWQLIKGNNLCVTTRTYTGCILAS